MPQEPIDRIFGIGRQKHTLAPQRTYYLGTGALKGPYSLGTWGDNYKNVYFDTLQAKNHSGCDQVGGGGALQEFVITLVRLSLFDQVLKPPVGQSFLQGPK